MELDMADADLTKRVLKAVDDGFDQQLAFLADLTRLPSLRGQEAPAQDFMARAFRDRGLTVDRWKIDVEDIQHLPGFSTSCRPGRSRCGRGRPSSPMSAMAGCMAVAWAT
jgi:acetylornithine deacetylase